MGHRYHVPRRYLCPRAELHHHAGFGSLLLVEEHRLLGKGQMNARLLHFRQAHDGTLQLALKGSLVIDVFHELGGAEVTLVEKLETDSSGFGESRGSQS